MNSEASAVEMEQVASVTRAGDALEALYLAHRESVFRYLRAMSGDEDRALDLTAMTFERAFAELRAGREPGLGWLLRTARNAAIDADRRARTALLFHRRSRETEASASSPEEQTLEAERARRVHQALSSLPEPQRDAIALRYTRSPSMTSPDLDGALRAALSSPMTARQRASLDGRLRDRLEQPTGWRLHVRPRGLVLLVAALLVAAPAVFVVSAALQTTESPNGLASAAAFQTEMAAAKAVVPLPAGATWPASLAGTDTSGSYSAGGGRSWVEFVAFCAWDRSWLAATASGSGTDAQKAEDVILATPTWEFYRGEYATQSVRDVIDGVIAGVKTGDPALVPQFVTTNCGE